MHGFLLSVYSTVICDGGGGGVVWGATTLKVPLIVIVDKKPILGI